MINEISVNITENAINKAKELLSKNSDSKGLRIVIEKGGC